MKSTRHLIEAQVRLHEALAARPRSLCSVAVLGALGLLVCSTAQFARAQGVGGLVNAGTVPVLRGVVAGAAVVHAPVPTATGSRLTVDQSSSRAIIDWHSFNIARGSEVTIFQPSVTASTLNRIYGNDPSIIQGSLRTRLWNGNANAPVYSNNVGGQIVLINQNGVLFDRGTQVNARSLVASSLNITNQKFLSGVITSATEAAFEGGYDRLGTPLSRRPDGSRPGSIGIGTGGPADAPVPNIEVSATGSILMFAPSIDNNASLIKAADGQVILAAGRKVYLSQNTNAADITLRGLVVEVEAETDGAGLNLTNLIRNAGEISTDRGNVSLAALAINQAGRISAKTAVQSNGSIYLKAQTRGAAQVGRVSFSAGSVTEVLPDTADKSTITELQDYAPFRGVIDISGGSIVNSGTIAAPGGRITLAAIGGTTSTPSRVYFDTGSITTTAGEWSDVDFAKSLATFSVTSNELKNSPNQRNGILRGAVVTADLRADNNILALDGYRGLVARTVAEKAAVGGDINITSSGDIVQRSGATIDVSGGGYRYANALIATTRLLGNDGRIYDIATAPEAIGYAAQLDRFQRVDERWGQTQTFVNPLGNLATLQSAYSEGKAGGMLNIGSARGLVLDGTLSGGVTIGTQQLNKAPRGALLRVGSGPDPSLGGLYNPAQLIGNVLWRQSASDSLGAAFNLATALSTEERTTVRLAAEQVFGSARQTLHGRVESGFGTVEINSNGRIVLPTDVQIESDVGASLLLRAPLIDIAGDIRLPSGALTITPIINLVSPLTPDLAVVTERVLVRSGAELSTAGTWINNASRDGRFVGPVTPSARLGTDGRTARSALDGGSITIRIDDSRFQSRLESGSTLDVGGGGSINSSRRIAGGRGGSLTVANGAFNQTLSDWLQADLRGFAIGTGGELTLGLNRAVIEPEGVNSALSADTTRLGADLFSEHGFSKVTVNAFGAIDIAPGTQLQVRQRNLVVDAAAALVLPSGGVLAEVSSIATLPLERRRPSSLALNGGTLHLSETASIRTDPTGEVALSGIDGLRVDGRVTAPGGRIDLALRGTDALTAAPLHVSSSARLVAAGTFVATPSDSGQVTGTLYQGGSISIAASQAGVRIDAGAVVDVSGINRTVDVLQGTSSPRQIRQTLEGHAGTVTVRSQGETVLAGTWRGQGGSATAAGGSFALETTRPDRQAALPDQRRIVVVPNGSAAVASVGASDAVVDVGALEQAGFEKLRLLSEDRIEFQGASTLDFARGIRLDAPLIELAGGASTRLAASVVSLGQSLGPRIFETLASGQAWSLDSTAALPTIVARAGDGVLAVEAGLIDFYGNLTLNGTNVSRFVSDSDVRFIGRATAVDLPAPVGRVTQQLGWLHAAGDLEFSASQLYPATRTQFDVSASKPGAGGGADVSSITVRSNGRVAGGVYSAAGSLSLDAVTIAQNGVVKAPQGQLELNASRQLSLGAGSQTSVSGNGLTVLFGTTESGVQWRYADGAGTTAAELNRVSASGKRIELRAPAVDVAAGASVDIRGGGDVLAVEFVSGNGGDADITLRDNTFAIIPKSSLSSIPYDSHLQVAVGSRDLGFGFSFSNARDGVLYDSIDIGAGSAVSPGEYALLPARFALLPDAYLVQLQTGASYRNLADGQRIGLANGDVAVAGHWVAQGTSVRESQSVGVIVSPGSGVRRFSDYTLSRASLFADAAARARAPAPAAPWDAGRLLIANAAALDLSGQFLTQPAVVANYTSRAAQIDIEGRQIAIVDRVGVGSAPSGFLELSGESLSRLNGSVLLGGTRQDTSTGTLIVTGADELRVSNSEAGAVSLPELLLTARNSIDVTAGSVLRTTTNGIGTAATVIETETTGAFVRLSNAAQTQLDRSEAGGGTGQLRIESGASLSANRSLLIDATGSVESSGLLRAGGIAGVGGSLGLASGQVSLGQTAGIAAGSGGLVLSNQDLGAYAALDEFVLRGYQSIDLLGASTLGSAALGRLTLDTPQLRGLAAGGITADATITADVVALVNNSAVTAPSAEGAGRLDVLSKNLVVGAGEKAVSGFQTTLLQADKAITTEGRGSLRIGGELEIETPILVAGNGSRQTLSAVSIDGGGVTRYGSVAVRQRSGTSTPVVAAGAAPLGGQITVSGNDVAVSTTVQARSGRITLQALGGGSDDGVTLESSGLLDAVGQSKSFNGTVVAADGGSVRLEASAGDIEIQSGSRVDVSAAAAGGSAGLVGIKGRALSLAGEIAGRAAEPSSGRADVDLVQLADFSDLNSALNAGGFTEERHVRVRSGDVAVAATDVVRARRVTLEADAGRIDVDGVIGSGAAGGVAKIELYAATGLRLDAGSELRAQGSAVGARGGDVRVATRGGTLEFDRDATIDVRAGAGGPAGSVIFGVSRSATDVVNPTLLQGLIRRQAAAGDPVASVDVEATRTYRGAAVGTAIDSTRISQLAADHAAFVAASRSAASAITGTVRDESGLLSSTRLLGATELLASGNLALDTNWDLTTAQWRASSNPGTLTIRAVGDLTISDTVGGARGSASQDVNHAILAGDTWNIRLAAGADLLAQNPLQTADRPTPTSASAALRLTGVNAQIRTGTGNIDLAASGDVSFDNVAQSIYTGGRIGAADTEANGNNRWAVGGGDISISAGGSVIGAPGNSDLWITEWLRRPRLLQNTFNTRSFPTDWWAYRPRFQDGVGALAGGDVQVRADGDVRELVVVSPTLGRTSVVNGVRQVAVTGGGNIDVLAGGDVLGGGYLVGRGQGRIEAAGDVGSARPIQPTQLYLMGASSGTAPEGASIDLVAGGSVHLQSIENPTSLTLINSTGAVGPSFSTSRAPTFFTYSANSAAGLFAKGGDVSYVGQVAATSGWRTFGTLFADSNRPASTAFPASLAMVAFDGDISGTTQDVITTFPSSRATVVVLANGSVSDYSIDVSDLGPDAVVTPFRNFQNAIPSATASSNPGNDIATVNSVRNARAGRIVSRNHSLPYGTVGLAAGEPTFAFDIQALDGSIHYTENALLALPAVSRLRAGLDIVQPTLRLQNLTDTDVTEVRAVTGDVRRVGAGGGIEIRGPGRLLLQAGRNVDIGAASITFPGSATGVGGIAATANAANAQLLNSDSARVTVVAGVRGDIDLAQFDGVYAELITLNRRSGEILDFYRQLGVEVSADGVLAADDVATLAAGNPAYARFIALDVKAPRALSAYQDALRGGMLPLGATADAAAAVALYALLNAEVDGGKLTSATSLAALAAAPGGQVFQPFVDLDARYPRVFADYVQRRGKGALPTGLNPIVLSDAMNQVVAKAVAPSSVSGGDILSFLTSIQTVGGSDIDLWAPGGDITVGLTTPPLITIGATTNAGGRVRSVLSGDFNINQGAVITAQGGDILIFSSQGNIDAGRGAKTSQATPAPVRRPILDAEGNQIGVEVVISASTSGGGIQSLTSDPDGLGPLLAPMAGDIYLFAPAGTIDAGEAGIRSSGNIVINAQTVLNASNISASGSSAGVPVAATGSLASALSSAGTTNNSKSAEEAAAAATSAARAAAAAEGLQKPSILTVEVLGFGDKNCKEQQKDCFVK